MVQIQPYSQPEEIEARSFAIIEEEYPEPRPFTPSQWTIARRLIHTTGDFTIIEKLVFSPTAIEMGIKAIRSGCTIYTDTEMASMGIAKRYINSFGSTVQAILSLEGVAEKAQKECSTRSYAGMLIASPVWGNSIISIGNAPTALLALTELLQNPRIPKPALVIAMPVGFVNALESKELFCTTCPNIPYIALHGRKGGSTLVVATINALAILSQNI